MKRSQKQNTERVKWVEKIQQIMKRDCEKKSRTLLQWNMSTYICIYKHIHKYIYKKIIYFPICICTKVYRSWVCRWPRIIKTNSSHVTRLKPKAKMTGTQKAKQFNK